MAYTANASISQVGPNEFMLTVTETEGPDPAVATECVLFTVPGARPYQPVTLQGCRARRLAGANTTPHPIVRASESVSTSDGSVEWEADATDALVYEEPRARIQADSNGQLRLYTTPDNAPGADTIACIQPSTSATARSDTGSVTPTASPPDRARIRCSLSARCWRTRGSSPGRCFPRWMPSRLRPSRGR